MAESCKYFLFWLYLLVNKNKVYSTPMIACCDVRVQTHFNLLEKAHLVQNWKSQDINGDNLPHNNIEKPLEVIAKICRLLLKPIQID